MGSSQSQPANTPTNKPAAPSTNTNTSKVNVLGATPPPQTGGKKRRGNKKSKKTKKNRK